MRLKITVQFNYRMETAEASKFFPFFPPKQTELKKCSGCRVASYCGRQCQRLDWRRRHRALRGEAERQVEEHLVMLFDRGRREGKEKKCVPVFTYQCAFMLLLLMTFFNKRTPMASAFWHTLKNLAKASASVAPALT